MTLAQQRFTGGDAIAAIICGLSAGVSIGWLLVLGGVV